ncbi:MAG: acyl-CoA dehydrogenase [Pseudomonadota bacterium]
MANILRARDVAFMLHDVIGVERFCNHPLFAGQTRDDYDQMLDLAEQVATEAWEPMAVPMDVEEPTFDGERVHIIPGAQEALQAFWDAGFQTATFGQDRGGMGLPFSVAQGISAWFNAANVSLNGYTMLSVGVGNMLVAHGSEEQIEKYLPPILEGKWTGTMCLSEPHAGSGLADIRTRAEPQEDGTYRLFGSKMWISAGEHELSGNIVHMVLAKIPGGPAGTKGISMFIVPKFLDDGSQNDVRLIGLNHKMGFRGTTNCALNFGDKDGAVGYLVGEPHQGLPYMFHMMNEARIGVGLGAACIGYTGYLHALDYAKERKQGRAPDNRDPESPMIPIAEHADVKRMLLQMKSYVEGGLMLVLYAASLVDVAKTGEGAEAQEATELLDLLTPIVKSWPSEFGLRANETAIQVLGGAGYTRDYPVERLYRDNRLNHIHEGTRGIQGMDLLGRKVPQAGGIGMKRLAAEIVATVEEAAARPALADLATSLSEAATLAGRTTAAMTAAAPKEGTEAYLANATIYLDMLGHVTIAWLWLKQALVAEAAIATASGEEEQFLSGKLTAARYFFRYELPTIQTQCALLSTMDRTCMEAEVAAL